MQKRFTRGSEVDDPKVYGAPPQSHSGAQHLMEEAYSLILLTARLGYQPVIQKHFLTIRAMRTSPNSVCWRMKRPRMTRPRGKAAEGLAVISVSACLINALERWFNPQV